MLSCTAQLPFEFRDPFMEALPCVSLLQMQVGTQQGYCTVSQSLGSAAQRGLPNNVSVGKEGLAADAEVRQ